MKGLFVTFLLATLAVTASAQLVDPVKWSYQTVKRTGADYDIILTASIEDSWHMYSQFTGKGGPAATSIVFKNNPLVSIKTGKPRETGRIKKEIDKTFGKPVQVISFSNQAQFVQAVSLKAGVKTNIAGVISYEVCNDRRCAQFKTSFDLILD